MSETKMPALTVWQRVPPSKRKLNMIVVKPVVRPDHRLSPPTAQ
jgi:hypothetical protein